MISKQVKRCCCEDLSLIENYEKAINDDTQMWECHHKLEIDLGKSQHELISMNMYWHRPASELIFLTRIEHNNLHAKYHIVSDKTKQKQSIAHKKRYEDPEERAKASFYTKGEKNGMYGKKHKESTLSLFSLQRKGVPHIKFEWLTPTGQIKFMCKSQAKQYHKDWILLEEKDEL